MLFNVEQRLPNWYPLLCASVDCPEALVCYKMWPWIPYHVKRIARGTLFVINRRVARGQYLKFNSTAHTFGLPHPSYTNFGRFHMSLVVAINYDYDTHMRCATWLWNKYILTLFYAHINNHEDILPLQAQNAVKQSKQIMFFKKLLL